MVYFLSKEQNDDIANSFRRYQEYLRERTHAFPPNAFALGTAEWYYNPTDHRCPHDARLENVTISEIAGNDRTRITSIRLRLLGAYQDGSPATVSGQRSCALPPTALMCRHSRLPTSR
jgi:hypothetical protein